MSVPLGYRFASTYAGIRKQTDDDLTLIVSDTPAAAAAVFTQNAVVAAPVIVSAEHLRRSGGVCRAIVANAGNANCATPTMRKVARATARAAAKRLGIPASQVLLASTGVIGEPLDEKLIVAALPGLAKNLAPDGLEPAAHAIMTTDTFPKTAVAEVKTRRGVVRLAGMAKGAGMIQPNMATMLSFILTDAAVEAATLRRMLKRAVDRSFNCISVDGDTSTNDTVYLLANGASGVRLGGKDRALFEQALGRLAEELAVAIVTDGEGSKKLLAIEVRGAPTNNAASKLARAIANSPLVKTALAGADPNWGRILSSAGASGVGFDPAKVDVSLNGHPVCRRGVRADFSEEEVQATMEADDSFLEFRIRGGGCGTARFWTCDLTEDLHQDQRRVSNVSGDMSCGPAARGKSHAGAENGDCHQFASHHDPRNKVLGLKRIGRPYPIFRDPSLSTAGCWCVCSFWRRSLQPL